MIIVQSGNGHIRNWQKMKYHSCEIPDLRPPEGDTKRTFRRESAGSSLSNGTVPYHLEDVRKPGWRITDKKPTTGRSAAMKERFFIDRSKLLF